MINETIGNLKIVASIGRGGMGRVFLAEHVRIKRKFAVKMLTDELMNNPICRERFTKEAMAQAQLQHPNIVEVIDYIEQNEKAFLVMEYVEGVSLDVVIEKSARIEEKKALSIFKSILKGLNFAHAMGVIHRDIKPSNILIGPNNTPKITDFGIALVAGGKRLTKTGDAIGTAWYMSPEQVAKPRDVDHRCDVYAMGIVLFEMLTERFPSMVTPTM